MISIGPGLEIPESELDFVASRSGGPGGQNVNKVSSRVTLRFDIAGSPSVNEIQRSRILKRLSGRINKQGVLQVTSQRTRSQELNREDALARFIGLLQSALHEEKKRIRTGATMASKEERLRQKKMKTSIKRSRTKGSKEWDE